MNVFWGRAIIEPNRAHVRQTLGGQPVTDLAEDGSVTGYALCGCLLIADISASALARFDRCSMCLTLLAKADARTDYPLWTPSPAQ
jgi:hypothetical protein